MSEDASQWKAHAGPWRLKVDGVLVAHSREDGTAERGGDFPVHPDQRKYELSVTTMCGKERVDLEVTPMFTTSAAVLARQAQIVASIGHVTRRACLQCRAAYFGMLTPREKMFLYQTEPKLGPVLGISADESALLIGS